MQKYFMGSLVILALALNACGNGNNQSDNCGLEVQISQDNLDQIFTSEEIQKTSPELLEKFPFEGNVETIISLDHETPNSGTDYYNQIKAEFLADYSNTEIQIIQDFQTLPMMFLNVLNQCALIKIIQDSATTQVLINGSIPAPNGPLV